jgi:hypothetical protein
MFSGEVVSRSLEEMRLEAENLLAEAARLKAEHEVSLQRSDELRRESVDSRPENQELAEALWTEAERLRSEAKELLRQSVERTLWAGEISHRIKIRAEIEGMDGSEEIWRRASQAGRV